MVTAGHAGLLGKVDYLALPAHALTPDFERPLAGTKTKLIRTVGVAHNRQPPNIQRAYKERKAEIPQRPKYAIVMLGGDAATPSGEIKLFTPEDAQALARYLATVPDLGHVVIANGPRTGKHNSAREEIKTAHRDRKLDYVTQAFIDELTKSGGFLTSPQGEVSKSDSLPLPKGEVARRAGEGNT